MEYGAMIPGSKNVYMKSYSLSTIKAWITEYSAATPLELVARNVTGQYPGRWTPAL